MNFEAELAKPDWSKEDALSLYLIDRWGGGYFDIDGQGHMTVAPLQDRGTSISIFSALQEAISEGLRTPLLIRFQDLLRHRVVELNEAFLAAIADQGYGGRYRGVYPIKVNQLREVVEEILDAGEPYRFGLEVGSKPEVFAGLAVHSHPESLIVCNGYKDPTYVRMALIGRKLDKKVVLVVEKISEIELIVEMAKEMKVVPLVGIRLRLSTKGAGKWATSGGESSKFGLSTSELLQAVEILQREGLESSLKLLHFHIGSQIPNILNIKSAVREAARYYAKLHKRGHPIEFLDVGGGLAI
ncbi:MAG TPA: biosynthetic arginine decarboxylase, partial [Acidobacteriota bacterium]|nr:biosynthetic arginine decarboxylase [Acidobacteriota bacterium]